MGINTPCIEWDKGVSGSGYGYLEYEGRYVGAHRLAYAKAHGLRLLHIKGRIVRHRCDNKTCVNPDHLLIGTYADNTQDMMERGRNRYVLPPARRGSAIPWAKLSEECVLKIKGRLHAGAGVVSLAKEFGVSHSLISKIKSGRVWAHLTIAGRAMSDSSTAQKLVWEDE